MRLLAILLLTVPASAQTVKYMDPPSLALTECFAANEGLWNQNQSFIEQLNELRNRPIAEPPVRKKERRVPCKKGRTRNSAGFCGRW